jgi:amino acid permease
MASIDLAIAIWITLAFALIFNLCAAGVVAIVHGWATQVSRTGKVMIAAGVTGVLPGLAMMPMILMDETTEVPVAIIAFLGIVIVTALFSLPGAIAVSAKLERPSNDLRVFE